MFMKYIFVTGGVVSGLGKGIVSASIGLLLKSSGFKVNHIKIDPYLNIDAGTMRPAEHGETFVTTDGGEIDQDLGNYERFLNQSFLKDNNITSGKVYKQIIENERAFKYEGRDVEMIPDVPNEVKRRFYELEKGYDFVVVEIGGTTGDIENLPFLYAAREVGRERETMYVMVSYVPYLRNVGEMKTKPTQHAISELRSTGIMPDILITRSETGLDTPRLETLEKRCFLKDNSIFDDPDCSSIYRVPLVLESQGLMDRIRKHFGIKNHPTNLKPWMNMIEKMEKAKKTVTIALVGKYVKSGKNNHKDVYVSVLEALKQAAIASDVKMEIEPIDSSDFNPNDLKKYDGIVAPQGWGSRGVEGIIKAIKVARENKIPYLGLCFGMQMAVVEFARNVLKLKGANSAEVDDKTKYPVIHIMPDQLEYLKKKQYGGTIRLGSWPCKMTPKTKLSEAYKKYGDDKEAPWYTEDNFKTVDKTNVVFERHRHRYEVNSEYRDQLEKMGMIISGTSPDGQLVEAVELKDHPFFVGTQFHPEYIARPLRPHPIFMAFVEALKKKK
ncbi:MAG: CTP synthase [Candidatus Shapirobacteria bacterium]|nr:CTP synthase [Candidatus Shapirobacteria bacterium]